tara:strand:- start:292 stop:465 length:174 start_codon:yes stop_codon:yes gene_type:complete
MSEKIKSLLKSRRFWTALGSVVIVSMNEIFGIDEVTANSIVAVGIAWIVGDSLRMTT